ncbi:MsnO8 family LLM class oxidoreductase [Novosphingobium colocasiae]
MIPLSILELGRVREGSDRRNALDNARALAQHAERLGYRRIWVAEHHNSPAVSTAATSLVVAHIAAGTTSIRVGAGGIMLPNHAPYVVAEQFGTLETLYPGRIDLGLGRAPGTDGMTLRALRRAPGKRRKTFLRMSSSYRGISPPGARCSGSRLSRAQGLTCRYGYWARACLEHNSQPLSAFPMPSGHNFSPQALHHALEAYRANFRPSKQLQKPYALVGVNVIAGETDEEARMLATSQQMSFADLFRGKISLLQPPIDDIEMYWTPQEKKRRPIRCWTAASWVASRLSATASIGLSPKLRLMS